MAVAGTRARAWVEQPWIAGGVGAGLAALTRLPVGAIRTGIFVMLLGTRFWLGLGIYAAVALVMPHRGRWLPGWSNVVGLLRAASLGLIAFLSRNISFDQYGIFGEGPALWVPIGGLLLIGWVAVLSAGRVEPTDGDRGVALAGLPALVLASVLLVVMWLAPGVRAEVVLDVGLVVVGAVLVLRRPQAGSAVAYVPAAALALVAILCAFSGASLVGGIGETDVAPRATAGTATYGRAIGTIRFDASRWRGLPGRTERVNLSVGIGNVWIVVPQDVYATIDARIGHGQLGGYVRDAQSYFVQRRFLAGAARLYAELPLRPGRLQINARVGDGCLIVMQPNGGFSDSNC